MKKAINLHVELPAGGTRDLAGAPAAGLPEAFAQANPGLQLTVMNVSAPDAQGRVTAAIYIEGDQEPAADFEALAEAAVQRAVGVLPGARSLDAAAAPVAVREVEIGDEDTDAVVAPAVRALGPVPARTPAPPLESLAHLGEQGPPPPSTFQGCPAGGDGHDTDLNAHKNRTDTAPWTLVDLSSIRDLPYPTSIGGRVRSTWSAAELAAVTRYEGTPIQVEGWLIKVKNEGPESCNCHSPDQVDYHCWLGVNPGDDAAHAVVCEVTPRIREQHPGLSLTAIQQLVRDGAHVRVSGWLLMDQEHVNMVGHARGTAWEIHPIMAITVEQNNQWVPLDGGQSSAGSGGSATSASSQGHSAPSTSHHAPSTSHQPHVHNPAADSAAAAGSTDAAAPAAADALAPEPAPRASFPTFGDGGGSGEVH